MGDTCFYVAILESFRAQLFPAADLMVAGHHHGYASCGATMLGAAFANGIPSFAPFLYFPVTLPVFALASTVIAIALYQPVPPGMTTSGWRAIWAYLVVGCAIAATVHYVEWLWESPPICFILPAALGVVALADDDRPATRPSWLLLALAYLALTFVGKVFAFIPLATLLGLRLLHDLVPLLRRDARVRWIAAGLATAVGGYVVLMLWKHGYMFGQFNWTFLPGAVAAEIAQSRPISTSVLLAICVGVLAFARLPLLRLALALAVCYYLLPRTVLHLIVCFGLPWWWYRVHYGTWPGHRGMCGCLAAGLAAYVATLTYGYLNLVYGFSPSLLAGLVKGFPGHTLAIVGQVLLLIAAVRTIRDVRLALVLAVSFGAYWVLPSFAWTAAAVAVMLAAGHWVRRQETVTLRQAAMVLVGIWLVFLPLWNRIGSPWGTWYWLSLAVAVGVPCYRSLGENWLAAAHRWPLVQRLGLRLRQGQVAAGACVLVGCYWLVTVPPTIAEELAYRARPTLFSPAYYDIWRQVAAQTPVDALIFYQHAPAIQPPQLHSWFYYGAIAGRQLFLGGWTCSRLAVDPDALAPRLELNRQVLSGERSPWDVELPVAASRYYAVVAREYPVPAHFALLHRNGDFALYEIVAPDRR